MTYWAPVEMLLQQQQQPLVLQSKGELHYCEIMITSTNHLVFKEHSTWIWHCLDQWEQQLSVTTTLWGTWASLQSQEKHKRLLEWVLTKSSPNQFVTQTLFFLSFGPCPCFQSTIFFRDFREAKRPRERLESNKILQRDCRGKRPESLESRAQRTLFYFYFFLCCVGHDFSFFFLFCFLKSKKILSLYINF